jgi:hypothetical protein
LIFNGKTQAEPLPKLVFTKQSFCQALAPLADGSRDAYAKVLAVFAQGCFSCHFRTKSIPQSKGSSTPSTPDAHFLSLLLDYIYPKKQTSSSKQ